MTEWLTLSLYVYLLSFTGELLAEEASLVIILEDKDGRIEPKPDFQSFSDKLHQSFPTWEVTCWRLGFSWGWGIYGSLNFPDGKWKKKMLGEVCNKQDSSKFFASIGVFGAIAEAQS